MSKIQTNTTDLQAILEAVNNLPEADSGGIELPELTTPATSSELFASKELIDADGNIITGTFTIDSELTTQDNLISQIQSALQNKASASEPVLQIKTVTPTTSSQNVTPDSGYDGLSQVTINAIPSTYVKPNATKAATTYTPTMSNQTIAAGTYCSGVQTIKGDANLKAENIAEGVSIFGVTGTHSSGGSGGGNFVIETATVTFINTNEDNDYDIMGTWVEGNYITSYETPVFCDDTKEKVALRQSHITIKPSIVKSISGNCTNYGDYTGARILYINGDCTITLQ